MLKIELDRNYDEKKLHIQLSNRAQIYVQKKTKNKKKKNAEEKYNHYFSHLTNFPPQKFSKVMRTEKMREKKF